jgi:hypothetical protein
VLADSTIVDQQLQQRRRGGPSYIWSQQITASEMAPRVLRVCARCCSPWPAYARGGEQRIGGPAQPPPAAAHRSRARAAAARQQQEYRGIGKQRSRQPAGPGAPRALAPPPPAAPCRVHGMSHNGEQLQLQLIKLLDAIEKSEEGDVAVLEELLDPRQPLFHQLLSATQRGSGWFPLAKAAKHGRAAVVERLISVGASLDQKMPQGETAVYRAAHSGHLQVVQLLCQARCDVSATNANGASAVAVAAEEGHSDVVSYLVEAVGVSVHSRLRCQSTVLWLAAKSGNVQTVSFLLQRGAQQTPNTDGQSPLHIAARHGHAAVVRMLIAAGLARGDGSGGVNVVSKQGDTPLFAACVFHTPLPRSSAAADVLASLSLPELRRLCSRCHIADQVPPRLSAPPTPSPPDPAADEQLRVALCQWLKPRLGKPRASAGFD